MAGAKPKSSCTWKPKINGASSQTFRRVQLCTEFRTQGISKSAINQLQDFHILKKNYTIRHQNLHRLQSKNQDERRKRFKAALNIFNTFAASYSNTQGLNNSCLKSPASTLVDLTFQSRALRSFSLNQLRNLSL